MGMLKTDALNIVVALHSGAEQTQVPPWIKKHLQAALPDHKFTFIDNPDQVINSIGDADVYFGWRINWDIIAAGKRLQWIHTPRIGIEVLCNGEIRKPACPITYGIDSFSIPMAEHVIGLMIGLSRKFPLMMRLQSGQKWDSRALCLDEPPLTELYKKTVGIVGLGGIGRQVAKRAKAFDMNILGTKMHVEYVPFVDQVYQAGDFETMIQDCDYIIVTVPLTQKTVKLFQEPQFRIMKHSAYFINVSRGGIVEEHALIKALQERWILGAGLDVFETEPLDAGSPLWQMPQVMISPHCCGFSEFFWKRILSLFEDNIHRFVTGKSLRRQFVPERGY